jgi:hypothetical protein
MPDFGRGVKPGLSISHPHSTEVLKDFGKNIYVPGKEKMYRRMASNSEKDVRRFDKALAKAKEYQKTLPNSKWIPDSIKNHPKFKDFIAADIDKTVTEKIPVRNLLSLKAEAGKQGIKEYRARMAVSGKINQNIEQSLHPSGADLPLYRRQGIGTAHPIVVPENVHEFSSTHVYRGKGGKAKARTFKFEE